LASKNSEAKLGLAVFSRYVVEQRDADQYLPKIVIDENSLRRPKTLLRLIRCFGINLLSNFYQAQQTSKKYTMRVMFPNASLHCPKSPLVTSICPM